MILLSDTHYAYVCDQEIYLNLGRVISIGLFIAFIFMFSRTDALRFTPIAYAIVQLILFFVAKSLEKKR